MTYSKLVVAVDLSEDAKVVLAKAAQLVNSEADELSLVHVIEPVSTSAGYDLMPAIPPDWENILQERAEDFLNQLSKDCGQGNIKNYVRTGSIKAEIFSLVEQTNADLIVLGTHGRHGLGLLLGSTATSVIHGTPCDVLAVRVA